MYPSATVCRVLPAAILCIGALSPLQCALMAQEMVTISRQKFDELTTKGHEADRLTAEVAELKAKLRQLEGSSGLPAATKERALTSGLTAPSQPGAGASGARVLPTDPTQWPTLNAKSTVPITELLAHYSANPTAADARYKGQRLKIHGSITAFDKPMFLAYYHVVFRDATLAARAIVRIYPPEHFKRIYVTATGDQIVGESPRLGAAVLASVNKDVIIEGKCTGAHDGIVSFVESAFVSASDSAPPK